MRIIVHENLSNHQAVENQLRRMEKLANDLGAEHAWVRHTHTSKSIVLPVVTCAWYSHRGQELLMSMRDNFHDISLLVNSETEVSLPLGALHEERDFKWYLGEIERKRNYCFHDWSEEEMADPRILRVLRKNGNGWYSVQPDEKDRWVARMTSTDWYSRDWSSTQLVPEGPIPFTTDTRFYAVARAGTEGMPEHAPSYLGPCKKFILGLRSWEELERVARVIVDHVMKDDQP
jgi:hypothetical protein